MKCNFLFNPLVDYVKQRIWQQPQFDGQYQCKLVRISPEIGNVNFFNFMHRYFFLPTKYDFYDVYSLAGFDMGYYNYYNHVNRKNPYNSWVNGNDFAQIRGVGLEFYKDDGKLFPRDQVYFLQTYDNIQLVAFKKTDRFHLGVNDPFFMHTYVKSVNVIDDNENQLSFNYKSIVYNIPNDLVVINNFYNKMLLLPGKTQIFVNGVQYPIIPIANDLTIGDIIEIAYDPTIYLVERYQYSTLKDYYSELDSLRKVILHPPKADDAGDDPFTVRYFDDCQFYVENNEGFGVYINRNNIANIRQLTHRDYGVSGLAIEGPTQHNPIFNGDENLYITVYYRLSQLKTILPYEANRIYYLYKLNDGQIVNALTGVNSTVPEWSAVNLEKSNTINIMGKIYCDDFTRDESAIALGYNAMTQVVSNSPIKVKEDDFTGLGFPVDKSFYKNATFYEYDENGLLLSWIAKENNLNYKPTNTNCKLVQILAGLGNKDDVSYIVGNENVTLVALNSYRVYKAGKDIDGKPIGAWVDITGDNSQYTVDENGVLRYIFPQSQHIGCVLFDDKFLSYDFTLNHQDHSLTFALTHVWQAGGIPLPFCPAQIQVVMNGHPLIRNVDYVMEYPNFYINNRKFIQQGAQNFTVYAYGLHDKEDDTLPSSEIGFVANGAIGWNHRYNLRQDRVTQLIVGGAMMDVNDVKHMEDFDGNVDIPNALNGLPYEVKHILQSNRYVHCFDNYYLFNESRQSDERVSNYLTEYALPAYPEYVPNIQEKYTLYSPFLNIITNLLLLGVITLPDLDPDSVYSNQTIMELTKNYQFYINYDPANLDYDLRYFEIAPYSNFEKLTVTPKYLIFIKQCNTLFFKDKVIIEPYFEVSDQ